MSDILKITPFGIKEVEISILVKETDPVLHQRSVEWDFSNPPEDAMNLSRELINTCKAYGGLGLSAVQIGKLYRVFCIGLATDFQVCFNPKVIMTDVETKLDIEGCLSFPGLILKVKRPYSIKVEYQMPNGEFRQDNFEGLTARCFLHELDHLDGITFTDKVGDLSLMRAKEKRRKFIQQINRRRKRHD